MGNTLAQRDNSDGFVKAGEMIEVKNTSALTLHDRRVLNLLIRHAAEKIADDCEHVIPMRELRSSHKGGERVRDSIERLMTTLVLVPTKDSKGRKATRRTTLLSDTTTTDDEDNPQGEVRYSFSPTMREILRRSEYWGRIKPYVMFAFSTKYALALYEALCLRRNLARSEKDFTVEEFREMLGVAPDKLKAFPQLKQSALAPAIGEINTLSDFNVEVEPLREGGQQRGRLTGFRVRWESKEPEAWSEVLTELMRPKVGRKARLHGTVESVADVLPLG
ncbi:MAG: RepB family plasmid replication initiator protein [Cytophagaceae bacterium]|nr:MAG: RepB family plasmid replication initiator protein [Cytophagaceae bacterium]